MSKKGVCRRCPFPSAESVGMYAGMNVEMYADGKMLFQELIGLLLFGPVV